MGKDAEGSDHNVLFPGGNEKNHESPSQKRQFSENFKFHDDGELKAR
jgi:hypothetical protein